MDLQRYDIIKAKINYEGNSVQANERPYVIVSNPLGTKYAPIITVMPLTSKIKKTNMPCHGCIQANENNGLTLYSMALGEQITTISKDEVISKIGTITDDKNKRMVDKVCFNFLFFGTDYKLEEVMA